MITKDTSIIEAVQNYPEIIEVFAAHGLCCVECMAAHFETIGQDAEAHCIDVDALIIDINKVVAKTKNNVLNIKNKNTSKITGVFIFYIVLSSILQTI
ncbi:MAG: DUF1858 domain-containing protein [Phascolarctobacterium sp.]|nr:DUF1858 domain-containing protein [Phascolarctobacterium sp.]